MKATAALIITWIIFLLVGAALPLATGPPDIYAAASLAVIFPYAVFAYYGMKRRPWAFLGSSALSVLLTLAVPFSIQEGMSYILLWDSMLATLLLVLVALESYKSYLQCKA